MNDTTLRSRELQLLVTDRREGKTTQAFNWVSHGKPTKTYPGWSRVLVVATLQLQVIHKDPWWAKLEDYDHRVFFAEEWEGMYRGHRLDDIEVCLDDLDHFLRRGIGRLPGRIVAATMTAWPWEHVEFEARPSLRL